MGRGYSFIDVNTHFALFHYPAVFMLPMMNPILNIDGKVSGDY